MGDRVRLFRCFLTVDMDKRKIIAVTGARSEYDLLYTLYDKLNNHPNVDFSIIIAGPHLSDNYGFTAQYVVEDGFRISGQIFNLIDSNQKVGRAVSVGAQIQTLSSILYNEKPDIVLVAGDREEAISTTLTCAYMDIIVAHFFGGDIAKDGNIDNSVRYASSKFAHLHFPTLEQHKENLIRLGEEDSRIFVVGNPALDRLMSIPNMELTEVKSRLGADDKKIDKYCVLIQHSIITETHLQSKHIRETLKAILDTDLHCFVNYPNSDAGTLDIINAYDEYAAKYPNRFTIFKNLDRMTYVNLLRNTEFLIGNSSSGILEVASLGVAAINVGSRQRGRTHGKNVIFVDNDKVEILEAISTVINSESFRATVQERVNPYGDGMSSDRILEKLLSVELTDKLRHKDIAY